MVACWQRPGAAGRHRDHHVSASFYSYYSKPASLALGTHSPHHHVSASFHSYYSKPGTRHLALTPHDAELLPEHDVFGGAAQLRVDELPQLVEALELLHLSCRGVSVNSEKGGREVVS